jgi:CheY-like chemotaxis protein
MSSCLNGEVLDMASGLSPLTGVTVLIVEDDNATRYILSQQLSQTGAIVTLVEDAEAAFAILRASTVDVLVIDLKLPASTASKSWHGFGRGPS